MPPNPRLLRTRPTRVGHRDVFFIEGLRTGGYAALTKVGRADVNLVHLPESIPFAVAAAMGCRYVTSFHGVADQAQVGPGEWVAVFACGGVGLSAVDIASGLGANVIAVSRSPKKLALAEKLGATHTVTAGDDAPAQIHEITGGGAHVTTRSACRSSRTSERAHPPSAGSESRGRIGHPPSNRASV